MVYLHSSKFTWKWRRARYKTTILYIGPSFQLIWGRVLGRALGSLCKCLAAAPAAAVLRACAAVAGGT